MLNNFEHHISPFKSTNSTRHKGVVLIGQCLMELWNIKSDHHNFQFIEHILFGNLSTSFELQKKY